ncbi:MAG: AAA family ATPase [Thermoguttaceae bacterium]|jgi:predicted ATPase|nr:AAA family ATPase [Thermoguttaceae bacterium]
MRVTRVDIENFKQFERVRVDLTPLNCLVGANNSGKTSLLQALALFDFCVHHCLARKDGLFEIRRRTISPDEFYVLPVSNPTDLWTDRKTQSGGKQKVIAIRATFEQGPTVTATLKLDYNRFGVGIESTDNSQEWLARLADHRIAYLPVFSVFLAQEERRTKAVLDDELARGRVHNVIRNLILDLKLENRHDQLLEVLRRAFPTLKNMNIEFDEVSDRYISVTYEEQGRARDFDVLSAGSGFQQFVYLFGFIHLREPHVILLDEPDTHLHGTLQRALLLELNHLVEEGKQVLLATHSRDLIREVSPENVLSLEQGATRRLQVAFDVYDALARLGSLDPTQLPVVQAYRRVLIVEDETDRDLLFVFCGKCLGSAVWQEVTRRLSICFAKGNPYKQPIERLREQLQQIIALQGRTLEAFVVADRDYYPDLDQLRGQLPRDHVRWHIWSRAEIENYLLCPQAIQRLIRGTARQRVLDEGAFRAEYHRLLEASLDSANDHLVEAFTEYRKRLDERWDAATMSRKAREFLRAHWEQEKDALVDAKGVVLPGVKRWLQEQGYGQFSNKALAEALRPSELPAEVHELARSLARFAGVRLPEDENVDSEKVTR